MKCESYNTNGGRNRLPRFPENRRRGSECMRNYTHNWGFDWALGRLFVSVTRFVVLVFLATGTSAPPANADSSFEPVWEEIKTRSTPAQLYGFLYELPKGGNLHTHFAGSVPMEVLLKTAIDKAESGGQTFYTRVKINNCAEDCTGKRLDYAGTSAPIVYYQTISEPTWESLSPCCRSEFKPL